MRKNDLTFSRYAEQSQLKQDNILQKNMSKQPRKVQWKAIQTETDTLHFTLHASKTTRSDLIGRLHLTVGQWASS